MRSPIPRATARAWLVRAAIGCGLLAPALASAADQAAAAAPVTAKVKDQVLAVTGTAASDRLSLRLASGSPSTLLVDVGDDGTAEFGFDRASFTSIAVAARGGDDQVRIDESAGVFTDSEQTTLAGEDGNDVLLGGAGAEQLDGGDGDDRADPGRGNDTVRLGTGNDRVSWDPGDGSDVVEGGAGVDELTFTGSNAPETVDVSAHGPRVRFFRDVAAVTIDLDDVERIDHAALGGADTITVHDLSGTDLRDLDSDLAGPLGSTDGQSDRVVVNGTGGSDALTVASDGDGTVIGEAGRITVRNADPAGDQIAVNALAGADRIDASGLAADAPTLVTDAGAGPDTVLGGAGHDLVRGGDGNDVARLGAGNDSVVWNPGDDNDTVEGQAGFDQLTFTGSNAPENIDVSATGPRVRFFRDVAAVTIDLDDVEHINHAALGGADTMTVHDLSTTDLRGLDTDLAGPGGTTGDFAFDRVVVNGTAGNDAIRVAGSNGTVHVTGLATAVRIKRAESANDTLVVNGLAGADTIDTSGLAPNTIKLALFP